MNDMEKFLNFNAIVKIKRSYDDELFKFIKLIESVGFLKEYLESFEKNCCYDKEFNEFSDSVFWRYVRINNGNTNDTCIEFQWGKGFTWGNGKDYLDYDNEMKILSVDELIIACNKEDLFKMNYQYTTFKNELKDKEIASDLDYFLDFYEWSITRYPDGKYNIKDEQCNTFDFEENTTFDKIIDRVYFRMFDYFITEDDIEELLKENEFEYIKRKYESYMKIGNKLNLLNESNIEQYINWFDELKKNNSFLNNKDEYPLLRKDEEYNCNYE